MFIRRIAYLIAIGGVIGCQDEGGAQGTPEDKAGVAEESGGSGDGAFDDLPDCSELIKKMEDCGEKESSIKNKRAGIQKDIEKGLASDVINNKCSIGNKVYKCSKRPSDKRASDSGDKGDEQDAERKEPESGAPSDGEFGIAACDDYVKMVGECKTFNRDSVVFKNLLKAWKKGIEDGRRSDVEEKCEKAARLFKCPKK
jgi:hypothetical protein